VRLETEVAVPIEGSDQTTVERIAVDVELPEPRTFLAGEPLSVVLPDFPGFQAPEPPLGAEEHAAAAAAAGGAAPRPDEGSGAVPTQAGVEAGATG
jgi:hypothetical protein